MNIDIKSIKDKNRKAKVLNAISRAHFNTLYLEDFPELLDSMTTIFLKKNKSRFLFHNSEYILGELIDISGMTPSDILLDLELDTAMLDVDNSGSPSDRASEVIWHLTHHKNLNEDNATDILGDYLDDFLSLDEDLFREEIKNYILELLHEVKKESKELSLQFYLEKSKFIEQHCEQITEYHIDKNNVIMPYYKEVDLHGTPLSTDALPLTNKPVFIENFDSSKKLKSFLEDDVYLIEVLEQLPCVNELLLDVSDNERKVALMALCCVVRLAINHFFDFVDHLKADR
jgi:hypothetical protein